LHERLAAQGAVVGFSTSGPAQAETIRAALAIRVGGRPLFRSVQATWNLLEPSAGPALAEAHDAGCLVIVKEALANGRLAGEEPGVADPLSGGDSSDPFAAAGSRCQLVYCQAGDQLALPPRQSNTDRPACGRPRRFCRDDRADHANEPDQRI